MAYMPRNKKQAYIDQREASKANMERVLGGIVRSCGLCKVPSSKRRVFDLEQGLICITCCNLAGVNAVEAGQLEGEYKDRLIEEAKKPKPENYGEWA